MVRLLGHRQTKETATDKPNLLLPRHIPTLPESARPSRIRMNLAFFNKVGMIHGYHHENREAGAGGKSHQY